MEGVIPRGIANLILVLSYLAFASSLAGLAYTLYAREFAAAIIFLVNLASISMVKKLYSKTLCRTCRVTTCPFNPRRKKQGEK